MLTRNEAPWIEYLEIDETTRERKLRDDAPDEIRKKYKEYLLEIEKLSDSMIPK